MIEPTDPVFSDKTIAEEHQWIVSGVRKYLDGDAASLGDHVFDILMAYNEPMQIGSFITAMFMYASSTFKIMAQLMDIDPYEMLDAESMLAMRKYIEAIDKEKEHEQEAP